MRGAWAGPGRGRPCPPVPALAVGGEDVRAPQLRQAQSAAAAERAGPRRDAARHHPPGTGWARAGRRRQSGAARPGPARGDCCPSGLGCVCVAGGTGGELGITHPDCGSKARPLFGYGLVFCQRCGRTCTARCTLSLGIGPSCVRGV